MTPILITGGAGFIPSALAEKLAENPNHLIVIADNLVTGSEDKIPVSPHDNIKFIKADVNDFRDISGLFYAFRFEYVFHYAALVGVQRTLKNPVQVLNEFPQNEHTTPLNSRLPYAIVKNVGEAFLKSYEQEYGLEYTVFRFFNTYGPKQSKDFVVSRFISKALAEKPLTIYGDGSQTRTFCYIDDNIDATVNAFKNNMYINDVVNIGGDEEIPVIDLAKTIIRLTGSKSKLKHIPALKEGDMTRRKPDISKMKNLLNRPMLPFEEGLKRIIDNPRFIL
jgi:UDP-glucose 4-epimerase